jgi:hypothetical protein
MQHAEIAFGNREADFDLLHRRQIGDLLAGADEGAGADAPRPDDAGPGCRDARLLQARHRQIEVRDRDLQCRGRIVEILRRAGLRLDDRLRALVRRLRLIARASARDTSARSCASSRRDEPPWITPPSRNGKLTSRRFRPRR